MITCPKCGYMNYHQGSDCVKCCTTLRPSTYTQAQCDERAVVAFIQGANWNDWSRTCPDPCLPEEKAQALLLNGKLGKP